MELESLFFFHFLHVLLCPFFWSFLRLFTHCSTWCLRTNTSFHWVLQMSRLSHGTKHGGRQHSGKQVIIGEDTFDGLLGKRITQCCITFLRLIGFLPLYIWLRSKAGSTAQLSHDATIFFAHFQRSWFSFYSANKWDMSNALRLNSLSNNHHYRQ